MREAIKKAVLFAVILLLGFLLMTAGTEMGIRTPNGVECTDVM